MLTIVIHTDNAAFEENPFEEVKRILLSLADGRIAPGSHIPLYALNGNRVGFAKWTHERRLIIVTGRRKIESNPPISTTEASRTRVAYLKHRKQQEETPMTTNRIFVDMRAVRHARRKEVLRFVAEGLLFLAFQAVAVAVVIVIAAACDKL